MKRECPICGRALSSEGVCNMCGYREKMNSFAVHSVEEAESTHFDKTPESSFVKDRKEEKNDGSVSYSYGQESYTVKKAEKNPGKKLLKFIAIMLILSFAFVVFLFVVGMISDIETFQDRYDDVFYDIDSGCDALLDYADEMDLIWYNYAYGVDDPATDMYTKDDNGNPLTNVDAVFDRIYESEMFKHYKADIDLWDYWIEHEEQGIASLYDHKEKDNDAFDAICDFYDVYCDLYNTILYDELSYNEFVEQMNDVYSRYLTAYAAADYYYAR